MSGWIKIHRSIQEHWLYTEKRKFSRFEAWNDILLTVNFADGQSIIKGKVYNIKRGQSILSLDTWAKRWNWEKSAVRRFLSLLQKEQMINLVSDNITTHLTVCKYEDYQDSGNANETQTNRKRNTNEIQTTPIKEEEERKEEKVYKKFKHLSLSIDQFKKLENDYTKEQIDNTLELIENYKENKKYNSLYLTCKNWLAREYKNGIEKNEFKSGDQILYENVMREMLSLKNTKP
jgi:hypothetical protein